MPDRLVYGAVRGMLGTLDPHSSFFDPREYAQMRRAAGGRYYGIGSLDSGDRRRHHRDARVRGRPAYKKGIRRGDVLARAAVKIAKGWTVEGRRCTNCAARKARTSPSASSAVATSS